MTTWGGLTPPGSAACEAAQPRREGLYDLVRTTAWEVYNLTQAVVRPYDCAAGL